MKDKTTFTIIHIISNPDLVQFHKEVKKYSAENTILKKRHGVSICVVPQNNQLAFMSVPYCYFEIEVTEQEYNSWAFEQKLGLIK